MKRTLLLTLLLMAAAGSALADAGPGCGPGKQIMAGQTGLGAHIAASLTNIFSWPTGSSAISSGTSGCKADGIILRHKEQEVFVAFTRDNVLEALAKGDGQHLSALGALFGCPADAASALSAALSRHAQPLLAIDGAGSTELLPLLRRAAAADPALAAACTRLG